MAEQSSNPGAGDTDGQRGPRPGTPHWVKVFGLVAAAVILLFVILLLTGNGHGPGRHLGPGGGKSHQPPPGLPAH